MSGSIFAVGADGDLQELREQPYESEVLLQRLLASHPALLAGDQVNSRAPRRWLLVKRESSVPGEEGGAVRWSLDHLFLDQDGVPTLVEVKRSADTRIRREVVGQMLDYAANAIVYWSVEKVIKEFEETCRARGDDPGTLLAGHLREGWDVADFWQAVATNLQAGRVRLVFVADVIPTELRRVVEFLNGQMDPAEVLALEVKQYAGATLTTLVPRVVGQTAEAQRRRDASHAGKQWDEATFLAALSLDRSSDAASVVRTLLAWARDRHLRVWWGRGERDGSFFPMIDRESQTYYTFSVWTRGAVEIPFATMRERPATPDDAVARELMRRLNEIPDVHLAEERLGGRPSIPLERLAVPPALQLFTAAFDWYVDLISEGST